MANEKFELRGINHLALVCKDMKRTVEFYEGVLGMPLTKTINLPNNMGQHFFFDAGNGDSLAFFWFPDAPESQPGITHPAHRMGEGPLTTAHASMNHVAFDVPEDKIEEVFDLFYSTKKAGEGTGIGMWMSYELVKKYKGEIFISSQVGTGTKVTIIFPEAS